MILATGVESLKLLILPLAVALTACSPSSAKPPAELAAAAPAKTAAPVNLFSCTVGAKTATVTAEGDQLTYSYGPAIKPEMTISGDAQSGNIFRMVQRFAGIEQQLRFQRGDYSYVVYSVAGNETSGSAAISGLVVMKADKVISDKNCASQAEFSTDYDWDSLPEDTEAFSIM